MTDQAFIIDSAPRVLIVDDMPVNRTILSSLLAAFGVASDMAENGMECIELYKKNKYDLILLDHRMPEFDGVDTLIQLKEIFRRDGVEVPVVCHTTEAGRDNINLYKAAGFADVLIKPIEPQELSNVLLTYLPGGSAELSREEAEHRRHINEELSVLPSWIKTVPKLDIVAGVENCDTAEDYVDTLTIFAKSVADKSAEIERYAAEGNWGMYTLRVHSLKSMARLIGAIQLSEHAADLEDAGRHDHIEKMKKETPALLSEYRSFGELLSRLYSVDISRKPERRTPETGRKNTKQILFVGGDHTIVSKGISNQLKEAGFEMHMIDDAADSILDHRFDADIVIYYPEGEPDHIREVSDYLSCMCRDDRKTYCIVGDSPNLREAMSIPMHEWITKVYERPINMDSFTRDMTEYARLLHEYGRQKSILVIDDDMDFLAIMEKWLKVNYKVDCARSGHDAIYFLKSAHPDLILLDYEMPEMDGYEVMRMIRSDPHTHRIPIIFLTGRNDRGNVMRILERKPDGYLLKSMPKEELLDSLERFFSESILRGRSHIL